MSKYKPGDKFIVEIVGVDNEASLRGYPHASYQVKGADCFSENVLDKLERVEPQMIRTNVDRYRNMSLDEMAAVIMCPYDTAGDQKEIMPCIQAGEDPEFTKKCLECCKAWLQKEVSSGKA